MKRFLRNAVYPNRCPFCDSVIEESRCACTYCSGRLPEYSMKKYAYGGYFCAAPFRYDGVFAEAVKRFKYRRRSNYTDNMGFYIVNSILELYTPEEIGNFDLVTCVPMHIKDLRVRKHNQAELLGRACAKILEKEYAETLDKIRHNKKQHTLKASERRENVKGVFTCRDPELVKDKNVLIIDDIITTGATLGECAKILKKAGCASVSCAVFCASAGV